MLSAFTMIMRFDNYSRVYIAARYVHSKHEEVKKVWKCGGIGDEWSTPRCVRWNFVGACGNYIVARQVTHSIDFLSGWRVRNFDRKLYLTRRR